MKQKQLNEILVLHEKYLKGEKDGKYANLKGADLSNANLKGADLSNANLKGADLRGANLSNANLSDTNLSCVILCRANLSSADLRDANLRDADLLNAKNIPFLPQTIVCPEKGSFIGFKKINDFIIELEIPAEAKRSSATTRKCRCEFAKVLSITNIDGTESGFNKITNTTFCECIYKIGETVYPDSFDGDRWNECSHGIHFFITRQEAVEY